MSFISLPSAFRTAASWAALPSAASVPDGTAYRVVGFGVGGFSFWVASGGIWRPWNGFVRAFFDTSSDTATPLATVGAAVTKFALPAGDLLFPAGMLKNSFCIDLRWWLSRAVTGVSTDVRASLNNSNNLSNGTVVGLGVSGTNADVRGAGMIVFDSNANRGLRDGAFTQWNSQTSAGSIATLATDIDTNSDLYFSLGSGVAFGAGDTLRLYGYEIVVRG